MEEVCGSKFAKCIYPWDSWEEEKANCARVAWRVGGGVFTKCMEDGGPGKF
jgi:hypothetical protein